MRNPNKLYDFYRQLQEIHITYFPNWRFCQMISNFDYWLKTKKNLDMFYLEEEGVIELMNDYGFIELMNDYKDYILNWRNGENRYENK